EYCFCAFKVVFAPEIRPDRLTDKSCLFSAIVLCGRKSSPPHHHGSDDGWVRGLLVFGGTLRL
ncbi:MAG: hypothetical protein VXZ15_05615, partial [Planctomycetota bacterium]|nr:hypothetical protein [Planctomycetota bacterium]